VLEDPGVAVVVALAPLLDEARVAVVVALAPLLVALAPLLADARVTAASSAPQAGQDRRPYGTDSPHSPHSIVLFAIRAPRPWDRPSGAVA
jgi:hypothetical protein